MTVHTAPPPDKNASVRFIGDGATPRNPEAEALLQKVVRLRAVERVTALPDFAVNGPEKGDSWVVQLRGWIVPALAANVVNCGIGLINTGLMARDISDNDIRDFFQAVWRLSGSEDYTLAKDDVDRLFLEGAGALTRLGWLREKELDAFEFRGAVPGAELAGRLDLDELVPPILRRLPSTRRPSRLQLRGNHFMELQVVDEVADPRLLKSFGLVMGQLVLMVHMDHQVTSNINLHYVLRRMYFDKPWWKQMSYFLSKGWFHFGNPGAWNGAGERWRLYFQERDHVGLYANAPEGRRYLAAYNLATNYGYAGRGVIYGMCQDVLRRQFGHGTRPRLVCDTNHESIRVQEDTEEPLVMVRRGAVECIPGRPALVAGSYDVPSLLGMCLGSAETSFSYDHGSANFRKALGEIDEAARLPGATVQRYIASYATGGLIRGREEQVPLRSGRSMEVLTSLLQERGAIRPVAWLRPVANLSQE